MRKIIALSVAALLVAGLFAGVATAGKTKKKPVVQHVEGSIVLPQPGAALANCNFRPQRSVMGASDSSFPNGVFGYTFEVDPKTVGQPFELEVTGGQGDVDLDILFYTDFGDPLDPTTAPAYTGSETIGPGGEAGIIPPGYPLAFVCMAIGGNATFTYMTGGVH